jgi:hypothetical protein
MCSASWSRLSKVQIIMTMPLLTVAAEVIVRLKAYYDAEDAALAPFRRPRPDSAQKKRRPLYLVNVRPDTGDSK